MKLGKRMGGKLILTAFLQASHLGTVGSVPVCVWGGGVADLRIAVVQELKPKIEMERKVCVCVTERVGGGTGAEGPWRWHRGR